jgi:hypothetical protein
VPAWAYLDVVTPDHFDSVSAQLAASLTESTVGNNEVSGSVSTPTSQQTPLASETSAVASVGLNSNNSNNPSGNTPAIIGGTVGGVLGLGLIVALVVYLLKQDASNKSKRQAPSAAFARARATPDVAAAVGFRSASRAANTPPQQMPLASGTSMGHGSSSNHGHRGPSPTPAVFQLGYANGSPWSPPPPSGTPPGAVSPLSAQSLVSTHTYNYGGGYYGYGGRQGGSIEYPNSSSGHGTGEVLGHSGSISSMRYVRIFHMRTGF